MLHSACSTGNMEEVKRIITTMQKNSMPLNCYNIYGMNPLHCACFHGKLEVVYYLISRNYISIDECSRPPTKTFATALHYAISGGHKFVVQYLLNSGVDTHIKDYKSNTSLQLAIIHGHKKIIKIIQNHNEEQLNECSYVRKNSMPSSLSLASESSLLYTQPLFNIDNSSITWNNSTMDQSELKKSLENFMEKQQL